MFLFLQLGSASSLSPPLHSSFPFHGAINSTSTEVIWALLIQVVWPCLDLPQAHGRQYPSPTARPMLLLYRSIQLTNHRVGQQQLRRPCIAARPTRNHRRDLRTPLHDPADISVNPSLDMEGRVAASHPLQSLGAVVMLLPVKQQ